MDKNLRQIRERRALSLRDLAKMSGVNENTISALERKERKATHKTIRKLASALGVSPELLTSEQTRFWNNQMADKPKM